MLWSKLSAVIFMQTVLAFILGRIAIPAFRKLKTGRYDPYIGDRFSADGSEPAFGGVIMWVTFAFGAAVSAAFCEPKRLFAAAVFTGAVTLVGAADDWLTDVLHKNYLVKGGIKFGCCYAACFVFLMIYKNMGCVGTAVLLPFRLGTIDLGAAFCPVTAAVMTLVISAYSLMNRFGADDDTCVDGLCQTVLFMQTVGLAVVGTIIKDDGMTAFGYVAAASAGASLIWGLSPAKLRSGSSGGYFCGGLAAAALCFGSYMELAALIACLAAVIDAVCSAVQYAVYRRSRKLLLKGSSLHSHIRAKGMSDYGVIAVFSVIELAALAAQIVYAVYSTEILI